MEPLVSVIIVNYNGKHYLEGCIESLKASSYGNLEIILVDNGSKDGSPDFMRSGYPGIRLIDNGCNLGLAIASNVGANASEGEYLFFFNNDTIADKEMLSKLVKAAEADERTGVCGCTTMTYDGKEIINSGVACDIYGYPFGEGAPLYVDAGIFIRRKVFYEIGGFDTKLFLYGEDRDICWRALLYGYDVKVVEEASFRHDSFCAVKGDTLTTNVWKRHVGERNLIRTMLKNYSSRTLLRILPLYMLQSLAEIAVFTALGRLDVVVNAYLRAYWWNIANIRDTLRLRKRIQMERRVPDSVIMERMSKKSGKLLLLKKMGVPKFAATN